MIYFLALLPATGLTVAGYIVLVLATRAEGSLRTFGRYLGFWAFTLAGLVILGAIFAAAHHHHDGRFGMRGGVYCPWRGGDHGPWPPGPLPPAQSAAPGGGPTPPESVAPAQH